MDQHEYEHAKELLDNLAKFDATINTIKKEIRYWQEQDDMDAESHIQILKENIKDMKKEKLKMSRIINKLSDYLGRTIFIKRYILCEKWKDIAQSLGGMCVRNAQYIHDASMNEFIKLLQEEHNNDKN